MTRAALETLVIALQHGLTTAQAELALDVTASAIAGDRNLAVTAAMCRAHRVCRACGTESDRWLPTSTWRCDDCCDASGDYGDPTVA